MTDHQRLLFKAGDFQDRIPAVFARGFFRDAGLHAVFALQQDLDARTVGIDDRDVGEAVAVEIGRAGRGRGPVQLHHLRAVKIKRLHCLRRHAE